MWWGDGCASFYVCKNRLKLEELYQWGEKLKRMDPGRGLIIVLIVLSPHGQ